MRSLRSALAAMGAATLAVALAPLASAQAPLRAPVRFVAPTPGQGQTVTASNPTIHAFVSSVIGQKLLVTVTGPATGPATVTKEVTAESTCQEVNVPVSLSHNGSYQVVVTTEVPGIPLDKCEGGTAEPRQFFVAAPPRPPSGVKATMGPGRAVAASWDRNPEPDIVSYRVRRSVGAGPFQQVSGEVTGTSFTDGAVPPGGPFRYQVLAVRRGKTPAPVDVVVSAPSAAVTVGGAAIGSKGGKTLGARLFDNKPVSGPPQPGAGAGAAASASEGGFDEKLPYEPGEEGEPTELGVNETSNSSHRSLAFVAGGFLVLAVYLHLWWLKRQAELPLSA